jgi:hypothetical protein
MYQLFKKMQTCSVFWNWIFFPNIPISHIFGKYMVELALAPIQDG